MTTARVDCACQIPELHHLPHSVNSLDNNSVDLEKDKQESKARWEMDELLSGDYDLGSFSEGWGLGHS